MIYLCFTRFTWWMFTRQCLGKVHNFRPEIPGTKYQEAHLNTMWRALRDAILAEKNSPWNTRFSPSFTWLYNLTKAGRHLYPSTGIEKWELFHPETRELQLMVQSTIVMHFNENPDDYYTNKRNFSGLVDYTFRKNFHTQSLMHSHLTTPTWAQNLVDRCIF